MQLAESIYTSNIKKYKEKCDSLRLKINVISSIRLMMIIGCIIIDYLLYKKNYINNMLIFTSAFAAVFLFLVYYHDILFNQKRRTDILIKINEDGLNRIKGKLKEISDGGNEFSDDTHPFSYDLDVFGDNSLFKVINTCATEGGRRELADILKRNIIFTEDEIQKRQEAIKELAGKSEWRQDIQTEGRFLKGGRQNVDKFIEWSKNTAYTSFIISIIASIFIFITACSVIGILTGVLPESFIILDLMVNYAAVKIMTKNLKEEMKIFESMKSSMVSYSSIFELIQDENFQCDYLKELQKNLILNKSDKSNLGNNKIDCKSAIKKLASIFSWIGDSRYNAFYFIINILFFSDIFLMRSMEKWRKENGMYVDQWMDVIHKIDEMCSFANTAYEHEKWSYPYICKDKMIEGVNIGHPLLNDRCVKNNFSLKDNHKTVLITGSNMSGKSTFLRTIGINMILSCTGSPVCAEKFSCGIMNLYTCMRTKDNLEESISSFYAEILRIKLLIEAAKKGEKVFFLLDEIFKGTNSQDRHTGAAVLIKQLIGYGGMGLVSTHDLELCDLEKNNTEIINYNFREFYENDKIKFDYLLRPGKSETRNAVHLMRLAGIDIN
ncbi:MutS family DNA mismatch repair protein [uncultured Clostridium sp.]|uniref:MutS family DNA mismatch repair protein n=1 Tax=uncultured Clostridium sp. TaxID=59620 RepID=UPI0025EBA846|nr:MutS family DNA mismatch repair protein [uncultured Clostridium sp.]